MWQGINHITNQRSSNTVSTGADASLARELNHFFARFDTQRPPADTPQSSPPHTNSTLVLQEQEVRRVLKSANPRKATGPDGVPGKVLSACADQLADVFTSIFNQSLQQCSIPACLKTSTIIPVLKKPAADSLNDYRPVALTPVIMKCFERLIAKHIKDNLPPTLDPLQFAYKPNRSTDDAISTTLHSALSHLDHPGNYVRLLFLDFSSAFNNIIPDILTEKLLHLGLSSPICSWIKDFLSERPQSVKLGSHLSSTISTGSPQGCVLSPLLFTLYTSDCTPTHPCNTIIKFADDTAVVGLISGEDETFYRDEVSRLEKWCSGNNLHLNTTKTKEIILDFRKGRVDPPPLYINGVSVDRVHSIRYLGVLITEDLSWTANTTAAVGKAQQRLHFLRILRRNNLDKKLLVTFYRATIESILTYCITAWYAGCSAADRKALQRVINTAQKITGSPLPSLEDIASSRYTSRARQIIKDSHHPNHHLFQLLPSGRRYRSHKARTNRLKNSFFPRAVNLLNKCESHKNCNSCNI
uniref:Reverse transcriptase domain-containing protein n=1 Tax=Oryzias latipes TaxID=8090 RepID=A0A3P9MQB6_ORYLA